MITNFHRKCRCDDVLRAFAKDRMSFFTFTTPDVVTYDVIRERWRKLRHFLVEKYRGKNLRYVMNFELHPKGHGWHIHAVFSDYIQLRRGGLARLRSFGFGMINVEKVDTYGVAQYLAKHCLKAYRGVKAAQKGQGKRLRLVNTSRGLPRLSDYKWQSQYNQSVVRFMRRPMFQTVFKGFPFDRQYLYASYAVLNGWDVCGLRDRLFHLCSFSPEDVDL